MLVTAKFIFQGLQGMDVHLKNIRFTVLYTTYATNLCMHYAYILVNFNYFTNNF